MKKLLLLIAILVFYSGLYSQEKLLTVAEQSNYTRTSTYEEVMDYISELQKISPFVHVDTIAISTEGRAVPILVINVPPIHSGKNLARIPVYIQANIHPGEIEGKEAALMLARDILQNKYPEILNHITLIICPNLNPDGNDKFSKKNRTNQNGPASVGIRYNGQNLDLNRDAMKLETPEMKGVVENVLNHYDPYISVDCHTTNGSFHEEPVTFTWMLSANGSRKLINFMRDDMMPEVSKTLREKYNVENCYYGNYVDRTDYEKGWINHASAARYFVNYVGVRNRLAILNENYTYADYKTRVNGCYNFLLSVLNYAIENKEKIENLIMEADTYSKFNNDSIALSYELKPIPYKIKIKSVNTVKIEGAKSWPYYKAGTIKKEISVDYFADYLPKESIGIPRRYYINTPDISIKNLLKNHGLVLFEIKHDTIIKAEVFEIKSLTPSKRLNQGHYNNEIEGKYVVKEVNLNKGSYYIWTSRKYGKLAAYLLEPQTDDSMLKWNYFDRYLVPQWGGGYYDYPVYRSIEK